MMITLQGIILISTLISFLQRYKPLMRWKQKVGKAVLINVIISQIMDTLPYDIHFMITFIHSLGYFKTIRNENALLSFKYI